MDIVDIGANLASKQFLRDLPQVIERAKANGVTTLIATGTNLRDSLRVQEIAKDHAEVYCTAGVHPHDASSWDGATAVQIKELACGARTVAVGECGLDFNRNYSPAPEQRTAFAAHIEIAAETGKPLFLHQRDAHTEFIGTLRDAWSSLSGGAVVHCFTEGPNEAEEYLDLGCHLGITGWVTDEKRGGALREAVAMIPEERLLIETDAPYLLPKNIQPKPKSRRCEPMHLPEVVRAIAQIRGNTYEEIAAISSRNARALFGLTLGE